MKRRRSVVLVLAAIVLVALGAWVVEGWFLPETAVRVDEAPPGLPGAAFMETLRSGPFEGKGGHHVSGVAMLVRSEGDFWLRFEDYEQTQGPDVFVYLTEGRQPGTAAEIESGLRVRIDDGPDGGEIVKEGSFNQRLPGGLDAGRYKGVAIWCDQFNVLFGRAPLDAT